jgi:hypothetical protein
MPRLWWALTQDELPRPRWRALQRYKILYTLFGVCPVWWGCSYIRKTKATAWQSPCYGSRRSPELIIVIIIIIITVKWQSNVCKGHFRATLHTRLRAHDHCILRSLIGRKDRDRPSSLHTRRWRPQGSKNISWMKSLRGFLHAKPMDNVWWFAGICVKPTSKR